MNYIPKQEIIKEDDVILVTGGSGLFGMGIKEVVDNIQVKGKWIFAGSKDCDLSNNEATQKYFSQIKPTYVIHLAAYVGGLFRNKDPNERLKFWLTNVNINNNVLNISHQMGVKKIVSCLSTCVFPDGIECPFNEDRLHDGPPHQSNEPYSYAKRCLGLLSQWINEVSKTRCVNVVPTNLYGKHDNFNIKKGHVLPGLMHKVKIAEEKKEDLVVYGTGKPLRQFLYIRDAAEMLLHILFGYENYKKGMETVAIVPDPDDEISIAKAAQTIVKAMNFSGKIVFDPSYADGQFRKTVSNKRFRTAFPNYKFTKFEEGVKITVDWFLKNYENCRK